MVTPVLEEAVAEQAFSACGGRASVPRLRTPPGFPARLLGGAADARRSVHVEDPGNDDEEER
jgi:hypothetical protein